MTSRSIHRSPANELLRGNSSGAADRRTIADWRQDNFIGLLPTTLALVAKRADAVASEAQPVYDPPPMQMFPANRSARWLVVGEIHSLLTACVASSLRRAGVEPWIVSPHEAPRLVDTCTTALLIQARPRELPRNLPERLRNRCPEIELLSIAGSWCEGELRTGEPWEDVPRVYWYDFEAWLTGRLTAKVPQLSHAPLLAIDTADYETVTALADSLAPLGIRTLWMPRFGKAPFCTSVDVGLWVGGQLNGMRAKRLAAFSATMRSVGASTIAMFDFPRLDEWQLAHQLGVGRVVAKPWVADDLADWVFRLSVPGAPATIESRRSLTKAA